LKLDLSTNDIDEEQGEAIMKKFRKTADHLFMFKILKDEI